MKWNTQRALGEREEIQAIKQILTCTYLVPSLDNDEQ